MSFAQKSSRPQPLQVRQCLSRPFRRVSLPFTAVLLQRGVAEAREARRAKTNATVGRVKHLGTGLDELQVNQQSAAAATQASHPAAAVHQPLPRMFNLKRHCATWLSGRVCVGSRCRAVCSGISRASRP